MLHDDKYDLAIIGGGPGGLSASIYAARANLKTVIFEHGLPGGQLNATYEIENYLGTGKINGSELAKKFLDHASLYDIKIVRSEVTQIKNKGKVYEITLNEERKIQSKAVILATGGRPRKLKIPGEKELYGNGVSYCATCDGFFFKNKVVIVVGGGDSAAEEAIYLAKLCNKVYLLHRRNSLRASKILQEKIVENDKIVTLWNSKLTSILAGEHGVSGVTLTNIKTNKTEKLELDGVFILIGYEPNNELFPDKLLVSTNRMVITDETCKTNMPGLYAIGDIRLKPARQIVLSVADGCNAALSVAKYIEKMQ